MDGRKIFLIALILIGVLIGCLGQCKDVVLVVGNENFAYDYKPGDSHRRELFYFKIMKALSEDGGTPRSASWVKINIHNLDQLPEAVSEAISPEDEISAIIFAGHGNHTSFVLSKTGDYGAPEVSEAVLNLVSERKLKSRLHLYFFACYCGSSTRQGTFQKDVFDSVRAGLSNIKKKILLTVTAHTGLASNDALDRQGHSPSNLTPSASTEAYLLRARIPQLVHRIGLDRPRNGITLVALAFLSFTVWGLNSEAQFFGSTTQEILIEASALAWFLGYFGLYFAFRRMDHSAVRIMEETTDGRVVSRINSAELLVRRLNCELSLR